MTKEFNQTFDNYTFINQGQDEYGIKLDGSIAIDSLRGMKEVKFIDKNIKIDDDVIGVFDQLTGLKTGDARRTHPYEVDFLVNVLTKDKVIERFRSYFKGKKGKKR